MCKPLYGKSKFYEKKRMKAIAEIAKWTAIKEVCEKELGE